jgi:hypothetical protein
MSLLPALDLQRDHGHFGAQMTNLADVRSSSLCSWQPSHRTRQIYTLKKACVSMLTDFETEMAMAFGQCERDAGSRNAKDRRNGYAPDMGLPFGPQFTPTPQQPCRASGGLS